MTGDVAIIAVPAACALIGALVYALSTNGKTAELGRIMFQCGLFISLLGVAGKVVRW